MEKFNPLGIANACSQIRMPEVALTRTPITGSLHIVLELMNADKLSSGILLCS